MDMRRKNQHPDDGWNDRGLGADATATTIYAIDPARNPLMDLMASLRPVADVTLERVLPRAEP